MLSRKIASGILMFSSARPFAQKYRRDGALRYFFFGMFGWEKEFVGTYFKKCFPELGVDAL